MNRLKLAVVGANGRMGQEIIKLLDNHPAFSSHSSIGRSNLDCLANCDVAIDFTSRDGTMENLSLYIKHQVPIVIGSTGFSSDDLRQLGEAAQQTPIFWSPNMALGPNLLAKIARDAAKTLGPDFAIDIIEAHHISKKDAPSGTALLIGGAINEKVTYHSIRGGDIVGEHSVKFSGPGEQLTLTHIAQNRSIFARGALAIAKWLAPRKAEKLYNFDDFISIS